MSVQSVEGFGSQPRAGAGGVERQQHVAFRALCSGYGCLAADRQRGGPDLGEVEDGAGGGLAQRRALRRPDELGAGVIEHVARQPLQFAHVEAFGRGRTSEGDPGEGQQSGQFASARGDEHHRLLAHVLLFGILDQVQTGNDGAGRADEVVTQPGGQPRGEGQLIRCGRPFGRIGRESILHGHGIWSDLSLEGMFFTQ